MGVTRETAESSKKEEDMVAPGGVHSYLGFPSFAHLSIWGMVQDPTESPYSAIKIEDTCPGMKALMALLSEEESLSTNWTHTVSRK